MTVFKYAKVHQHHLYCDSERKAAWMHLSNKLIISSLPLSLSLFVCVCAWVCTSPATFSDTVAGQCVLLFLTGSQYSCYLALKREGLLSDGLNHPLCGAHPHGWQSIFLSAPCMFLSFCLLMACHKDTKEQYESFTWPKFIANVCTLVKVLLPENLGEKKGT